MLEFDSFNQIKRNSIKVIGVGGGGGNAVNHMYRQGIEDVDFYICNTDRQALVLSPIVNKIQIGQRGTGAGSNPMKGKECAIESMDKIREIFTDECDMLFITAGMGGGTGTGAAPVIAQMAKELGILTVAIVTLPFAFEGSRRLKQAAEGLEELRKTCDGILVINNDKLRELYGNVDFLNAFKYADNVLCTAASGIARFVTSEGVINGDFEDVKSVIKDAGRVIMGTGEASGENRAIQAVERALNSPLLDDNDISGAKDMLLYIVSGTGDMLKMDELTQITDYICDETGCDTNIIQSLAVDESLGDKLSITCIVAGLEPNNNRTVEKEKLEVVLTTVTHNADTNDIQVDVKPSMAQSNADNTINKVPQVIELSIDVDNCEDDLKVEVLDEINMLTKAVEESNKIDNQGINFEVKDIKTTNSNQPNTTNSFQGNPNMAPQQKSADDSIRDGYKSFKNSSFNVSNAVSEKLVFIDPRNKQTRESNIRNPERIDTLRGNTITPVAGNVQPTAKEDFRKQLEKMNSINFAQSFATPAFQRRNVTLVDVEPSDSQPKTTFVVDSNSKIKENSFLHKSID